MQEYIDTDCILSEAQMMWQDYRKAYLLLEGSSDKMFFSTLMDTKTIVLRALNGWERVYDAVKNAIEGKLFFVAGVIDRDYHDILEDGVSETRQLFFTDYHDIEMMMLFSSSFDKFLAICGSCEKLKGIPNKLDRVMQGALATGALRYLSLKNNLCLDFDRIDHKSFVDRKSLASNTQKLVEVVLSRTCSSGQKVSCNKSDLVIGVEQAIKDHTPEELCNGHDAIDVLCIAMSSLFASGNANAYSSDSIFSHLLMGYMREDFCKTRLSQSLETWLQSLPV